MKYEVVLWDFDGTMVDTSEGIFQSLRYAFDKMRLPAPSGEILSKFIGPPLTRIFRECVGLDDRQAADAVRFFREDYRERGIFVAKVYGGIHELVLKLKAAGVRNAVSTLKPERMARQLLEKYGMLDALETCCGTVESRSENIDKSEIISRTLDRMGYTDLAKVVMIGDTGHDASGACKAGVDFISAAYGYGFRFAGEKLPAGLPAAGSVAELEQILLADTL
ncbi:MULTISPECIES: HAD hydrolase-like protein [Anaerotruncus]|jgi:phosphoglycolate phosphatase|uniref:HAD hydrolase-like protein n=1 Tax=Anaerotruncus TaxID=244127 RepID=UPI0008377387|nr:MULTISPECIES: HAD hydrolase-like protein [Anaerotruncus]RGX56422.1 HAD family hydrolase [Anaerotruncus sp. AF02-27]